jgi:transcriptional regulator with XRE-family HTH domain
MRSLKSHNIERRGAPAHPLTMSKDRRPTYIKAWREFRCLSQEELGHRMGGMTGGNVSLLERGLIDYNQESLENAAIALDCSVLDLLTRPPQAAPDLYALWQQAGERERAQFAAIAETILKTSGH